jgi:hypothetical protein
MTRHLFGTVGSVAALTILVGGCVTDPTSDLRGGVDRVTLDRTFIELEFGDSVKVEAQSWDQQGNVTAELPTVASSDPSVIEVVVDEFQTGDPLPRTIFWAKAVGVGEASLTATAGGVTSGATRSLAFPVSFSGAVSTAASGMGWDVVTIAATSTVKFDPELTTATIDGVPAYVHSITADQLQLVSSSPDAVTDGVIEIENLVFLDEFTLGSLEVETPVTISAFAPGFMTDDISTAPDVGAGPFPLTFYGMVSPTTTDLIVRLSPSATVDLSSAVSWAISATDIDVFYTDASDGFVDCLGCGGSNPETGSWTITGGDTNYFYVELYDGDATLFQVKITSP